MTGMRSWLHVTALFISIVHGCKAQMIIEPSTVVEESGDSQDVNMTCSLSPELQVSTYTVTLIQIRRNSRRDKDSVVLATIAGNKPAELGTEPDIVHRNPVVSGDITHSQTAGLYVIWNATAVECEDAGDYECKISYLDDSFQTRTFMSSMSFSFETLPSDIRLMFFKNKSPIQPDEGTADYRLSVDVGDLVDLRCSGNIGSNSSTLIEWYWTDPLSGKDGFQRFIPGEGDVVDDGIAIYVNACQYQRESKLQYNVTMDVERNNNIAFKCSVTVDLPDQEQRIFEGDRVVYLSAAPGASTTNDGAASTTVSIPTNSSKSGTTTINTTVPGNNTNSIAALSTNFFNLQVGLIILAVCMAN